MRFFDLVGGDIRIDGISTSDLTRENIHELFGMVLQDTWLFDGTVRENLVYNKTGVTDEELEKACRACGIYHFIETLPNGFDTVLGENVVISAGQKQLFTIARAMIKNQPNDDPGRSDQLGRYTDGADDAEGYGYADRAQNQLRDRSSAFYH